MTSLALASGIGSILVVRDMYDYEETLVALLGLPRVLESLSDKLTSSSDKLTSSSLQPQVPIHSPSVASLPFTPPLLQSCAPKSTQKLRWRGFVRD